MQNNKKDNEILAEIYRNANLALTSISDIMPSIESNKVKNEIMRQHEEYERICAKASALAKDMGVAVKEPSPIKKAMMWGAIKMNTAVDNSAQNVATLMIRGTVNGIAALKTSYSSLTDGTNANVKELLGELIAVEENNEKRLKALL